jgi:hypothetical protein
MTTLRIAEIACRFRLSLRRSDLQVIQLSRHQLADFRSQIVDAGELAFVVVDAMDVEGRRTCHKRRYGSNIAYLTANLDIYLLRMSPFDIAGLIDRAIVGVVITIVGPRRSIARNLLTDLFTYFVKLSYALARRKLLNGGSGDRSLIKNLPNVDRLEDLSSRELISDPL